MNIARLARSLVLPSSAILCIAAWGCQGSSTPEGGETANDGTNTTAQVQGNPKEGFPVKFTQVATLLDAKCMPCHNAQNKKGGLDLTTYQGATKEIKVGDPDASELMQYVRGQKTPRMPFNKPPLTAEEEALLASWIKGGAEQ